MKKNNEQLAEEWRLTRNDCILICILAIVAYIAVHQIIFLIASKVVAFFGAIACLMQGKYLLELKC